MRACENAMLTQVAHSRRLPDAEPQAQRAMRAHEGEHLVHRRDQRREPAQPRACRAIVAEAEEQEVLVVLVEPGNRCCPGCSPRAFGP